MTKPGRAAAETTGRRSRCKADAEHYRIVWQNPITGATVQIRITHTRDYLAKGQSHIEIETAKPPARRPGQAPHPPLPITETGYRSHFIDTLELVNAGGPVTFVTAWIEREAKGKAWLAAETARAQGDLFQWADANRTATKRKAAPPVVAAQRNGRQMRSAAADHDCANVQTVGRSMLRGRNRTPKPPRGP